MISKNITQITSNGMKKYLLIFIFASFLFSGIVFAETSTTGFIPGQIWYSKQPLVEGDTVDIHTIIWNGDASSISATIEFYDKNVILGARNVVVPSKTSKDVSVSWKITAGDHLISASIISSKITNSTKTVDLSRRVTDADKQFVAKIIENVNGTPATSIDIVQSKIGETTSKIVNIIPASVSTPVSETFSSLDDFRSQTASEIVTSKVETQKKLDELNKTSTTTSENTTKAKTSTGIDGTEKPITYVKLFFLSVAGFIFGNKIVFYLVLALIAFIVVRFIYRKIRNR